MSNQCGVCRSNPSELISLKFKDDKYVQRILYKLKCFISSNVSDKNYFHFYKIYFENFAIRVNKYLCHNFMMHISQVMNYDPYLTSFICLQCLNKLEVAYKFKRTCDDLNAGQQQALKQILKPSQIIETTSCEDKGDIKS